jgi:hypothetical protein
MEPLTAERERAQVNEPKLHTDSVTVHVAVEDQFILSRTLVRKLCSPILIVTFGERSSLAVAVNYSVAANKAGPKTASKAYLAGAPPAPQPDGEASLSRYSTASDGMQSVSSKF